MKPLTDRDKQRVRQLRDMAAAGDENAADDLWREFGVRIPNSKASGAGPTAKEQSNPPAKPMERIWHSLPSLLRAA